MKLLLVAVGRLKAGPERELCQRYEGRFRDICRQIGISDLKIVELSESAQRRPADRMAEEARSIAAALPRGCATLLLDERGKALDSPEFAQALAKMRGAGAEALALVIGGPDGLDPSIREGAGLIVSFGRLTLPHQIVRALALEQLYRAATLLTGHPYHRA